MAEPYLTPERLADIRTNGSKSRRDEMSDALHEGGLRLGGSPNATSYRPRVLYGGNRTRFWPRGDAAAARIYRILEGCAKSPSLEAAVKGAQYKGLAQRYMETWVYFTTRDRPPPVKGTDHNPFRHLSDRDAERKFQRIVEDICDASTGVLGSWWTK